MRKEHTKEVATIKARCVGCQKVSQLTAQQIQDAESTGCAMSTCCYMPMVVESARIKKVKKSL